MGEWVRLRDGCPEFAASGDGVGVLTNTPGRPALGEELVQSVNSARHSIIAMNPLVVDQRMVGALIAARRRRVRVKLITELRDNRGSGVRYPTRGFEVEKETTLREHFTSIRTLAKERVLCRGLRHYAHGKVLIVDNQQILLSSANWTANSLGWGVQSSLEAGMSIREPAIVSVWANAMSKLWESCPFRMHALGGDVSLQQEPASHLQDNELERPCITDVQMSWSHPPGHYGIRNQLADAVRRATERIVFSALSFYDTDQIPILHCALEQALTRGVEVTVVVRPEHFPVDQYPDPSTCGLLERGLILRGVEGLHAKGIVVDSLGWGFFSANINPFSLQSNAESALVDCGIFVRSGSVLTERFGQLIEELDRQATHTYCC